MKMPEYNRSALPLLIPRSYTTTESNKTGSWRFLRPRYLEKTAPCSRACPLGQDVPKIQMLTVQGAFKEAWELILRENPFPGICGRVCFHPCEGACNREEFDEAVAIHVIERFLAETAARYELKPRIEPLPQQNRKIAIVGAGPAGLSAAYFVTVLGYSCDVFEARMEPGGMLRWAIPVYRLPLRVVREEIRLIESLGARIRCGMRLSVNDYKNLKDNYDAIFLGCGYQKGRSAGIEGEDLPGVEDGLEFLKRLRSTAEVPEISGDVAVIGGGNTAIDVARSVIRCGGTPVIIYRRRREDMRAFKEEIEMALDEGVKIVELRAPAKIKKRNGRLVLSLRKMKISGTDETGRSIVTPDFSSAENQEFNRIFMAIGTEPAENWYGYELLGNEKARLSNSTMYIDNGIPVVLGGDLAAESRTVTNAIASGKEAAMMLDIFFREGEENIIPRIESCRIGSGNSVSMEVYLGGDRKNRDSHVVTYDEINSDYFTLVPRIPRPRLLKEERIRTFAEIDLRISASMAMKEAGRCFNCGICNQCDNCYLFCPEIAVVRKAAPEGSMRSINYDYCKGCGLCVVECPRNAMVLEEETA